MGWRVKRALANFATAAASGNPAAVAQYQANLESYNVAQARKKGGFFGHLASKYDPRNLKNTIMNPKVGIQDFKITARAGFAGNLKDKRAALRAHHATSIHPFDSSAQNIVASRKMARSHDPNVVAQGLALRSAVDTQTMRDGKTGAAVGITFLAAGALAGSSVDAETAVRTVGQAVTPSTSTLIKAAGSVAMKEVQKSRAESQKASNGIADTSTPNGTGYEPGSRYSDRSVISQGAHDFFATLREIFYGESDPLVPEPFFSTGPPVLRKRP